MKYKTLYKELAEKLTDLGCFICDIDVLGHCKHTDNIKAFVYIKSGLNYKHKYFVLAHEAGHLFNLKNDKFTWAPAAKSEEEANRFAFELFDQNDIDPNEYCRFYEKAKKKVKKRKKSWFEI